MSYLTDYWCFLISLRATDPGHGYRTWNAFEYLNNAFEYLGQALHRCQRQLHIEAHLQSTQGKTPEKPQYRCISSAHGVSGPRSTSRALHSYAPLVACAGLPAALVANCWRVASDHAWFQIRLFAFNSAWPPADQIINSGRCNKGTVEHRPLSKSAWGHL